MGVTCKGLIFSRGQFRLKADWSLPSAASLALIGPSGAGKSLFLGGLAGFDQRDDGRLIIEGTDVTDVPPQTRPITLMFQDHNLFPHLNVVQNVGLGVDPGLRLDARGHERVHDALSQVELSGLGKRYPSELSGGQQSRVALARALIRKRPLLALDEPFSALGPGLRRDMLSLVETIRVQQNATLIFVTHTPEDARRADYVSYVQDGQVSAPREAAAFFADPPATLQDYL
jgi:thiamine transport system ATP-binding protein